MFRYSEFVQTIKKDGLARQNRFFINIALPGLVGEFANLYSNGSEQFRRVNMFCKSISFPGISFSTSPIRNHGEVFEAPYDRNFQGLNATFYVDRNMYVRKFFDEWVDSIQNPDTRDFNYYKDFVSSEITLYVLDSFERVNYVVMFFDVHPKSIGALSLDQGANDNMTLDIQFDYHYYKTFVVDQVPTESTPGYDQYQYSGTGSSTIPNEKTSGVSYRQPAPVEGGAIPGSGRLMTSGLPEVGFSYVTGDAGNIPVSGSLYPGDNISGQISPGRISQSAIIQAASKISGVSGLSTTLISGGSVTPSLSSVTGAISSVTGSVTGAIQSATGAIGPTISGITGAASGAMSNFRNLTSIGTSIASSAKQLQNTFSSTFGSVTGAVSSFRNDFLGFQRGISQGLGSLNSVTSDIRSVINAPTDVLNSAKGTIRDVSYGVKNFKSAFKLFK